MLTPLKVSFAEEYVADPTSATRRYTRAGGTGTTAGSCRQSAHRLLMDSDVKAAIEAAKVERARAMAIDSVWLKAKLALIVARCLQPEPTFDSVGEFTGTFKHDPRTALAALDSLRAMLPQARHDDRTPEEANRKLREHFGLDADEYFRPPDEEELAEMARLGSTCTVADLRAIKKAEAVK